MNSISCLVRTIGLSPIVILIASFAAQADGGFLRTAAPLDDSRGYCLDVAGFGANVRTDEPLRVHTCKYGEDSSDQLFQWVDHRSGHVVMPAYDKCLAAEAAEPGAALYIRDCVTSELQSWDFIPSGNLVLRSNPDLCLTVGAESFDAGSAVLVFPGYRFRSSTMEPCRDRGDEFQDIRWGRADEHERGVANALRAGMPADIRAGIRAIRENNTGNRAAQTFALYDNVARAYRSSEVATTADLAYGDHDRHRLDVHVDTRRRGNALQPVVMYVHGGGYVRGSKEATRNVGEFFASIGLVGVSMTYRLAPEFQWPEGANDVGAAVQWVNDNITDYGGDPEQIYIIGNSAGAGHAANYAFRPEVLDERYSRAAGVVLIGGSFTSSNAAYFGTGRDAAGKAVLGNVSQVDMKVMITTAEFDLDGIAVTSIALANEIANEHGHLPRIRQLPGHNHYSGGISIGTADRLLSNEILDFVLSR